MMNYEDAAGLGSVRGLIELSFRPQLPLTLEG